jgi:L-ascorbate metabolism protein UlaG (beta-lactamase superfamily)
MHSYRLHGTRPVVFAAVLITAMFGIANPSDLHAAAHAKSPSVKMEWFGWSFFRFTSPTGKVILTNPYITGNPDASVKLDDITKADLILVPNGHGDEIGDTIALAKATGARVVTPFELGTWFASRGVPDAQVMRRNPGTRFVWEGITIRVVGSVHGSGSGRDTAIERAPIYGGAAAGFIITFENGWTVYFPGSSAATQDMALWGATYKPDAMIFLMHSSGEPQDIGMAIRLVTTGNPNLKTLWPHHHRVTPPAGAPTVSDVRAVLDSLGIRIPILNQERGKVYEFTK